MAQSVDLIITIDYTGRALYWSSFIEKIGIFHK